MSKPTKVVALVQISEEQTVQMICELGSVPYPDALDQAKMTVVSGVKELLAEVLDLMCEEDDTAQP